MERRAGVRASKAPPQTAQRLPQRARSIQRSDRRWKRRSIRQHSTRGRYGRFPRQSRGLCDSCARASRRSTIRPAGARVQWCLRLVAKQAVCAYPHASRKGEKMLREGDKLPAVTLLDDEGAEVTTTDLLGGPLVLYFYPKDDTPGCTSEASQF